MSSHPRSLGNVSRRTNQKIRGTFETLEPRLALTVDLGFAAAFETLGPSSSGLSNSTLSGYLGGGMVTDSVGNSYVTLNSGANQSVDLDPGPAVKVVTLDAGVVKLDPNGALVWEASLNATGGISPVVRALAAVDADQNVYLVGDFRGTVDFDPGAGVMSLTSSQAGAEFSVYLTKLNSAGQLQWVRILAGHGLRPDSFDLDGNGNLLIAANFSSGSIDVDPGPGVFNVTRIGTSDQLVLKYDSDGDLLWARQIAGVGADVAIPARVAIGGEGDVFVAGRYSGSVDLNPGAAVHMVSNSDALLDGFVLRLTPAGDFVWAYATEGAGSASFRDIEVDGEGSVIVGGSLVDTVDFEPGSGSLPLTMQGVSSDGLLLKLNSDSSVAWVRQFGGSGATRGRDVAVDEEGNVYLGGYFNQTSDFDPGPGLAEFSTPWISDTAYVVSLTDEGSYRWALPVAGNQGLSEVHGLSVTGDGIVHFSGVFKGNADFNPNPGTETWLNSGTAQSVFVATLKQSDPIPGAPVVDAGANQTILVTSSANLNGTVTDDGLPIPVTTTWSVLSGPGTVTFGNAAAIDTTATFSTSGSYWLQLTATDTQFTTTDIVQIVVNPLTATLTATADTYIDTGKATTNFGAAASLTADGKPDLSALLKWNLSSIPTGSTLQSVSLSVNVTGTSPIPYEIYELKRNWVESQATWKKFNSATNWQSAGAQGALDRGSTVLGTVSATATGIRTITLNAAGLAVVQGWINNPATNFGFILQDYANSADDDLLFSSREATVAANRPQLQLVYNPPSVAPLSLRTVAATASAGDMFASKLVQTSTSRNNIAVAKLVQPVSLAAPHDNALLAWLASRHVDQENAEGESSIRPDATAAGDADQDESNESLDAAFASLAIGGH